MVKESEHVLVNRCPCDKPMQGGAYLQQSWNCAGGHQFFVTSPDPPITARVLVGDSEAGIRTGSVYVWDFKGESALNGAKLA
jgi:hypothetical protein